MSKIERVNNFLIYLTMKKIFLKRLIFFLLISGLIFGITGCETDTMMVGEMFDNQPEYLLENSLGDKTDKLQSIAPQIKSATEGLITSIKKLTDEVAQQIKSINDGAMKRIEDSIGKNEEEIVRSLDKHREEKVEAIEKLNSSLDKMNKAINSLIDIWGKLAFNKMLNNSALRRRLRK